MNHYLNVLIEGAWYASILPLSYLATLPAMKIYGGFNIPLATVLGIIGGTAGQLFNWYIGHLVYRLKLQGKVKVDPYWYDKISGHFNKYGIFLLLFCWFSIFNYMVVIAGFLGAKCKLVAPLVFAATVWFYWTIV